ncbi:LPS sulfotransferase NodH [Paraburkholderia sp. JPY162]|uniref:LPS sulfotransferase NodH n=2 Tax=Paraburkholderia youngii TaxID=2782701 RepID=A0A7W8L9S0_9BURK|nr:LPS sulfotransferase NodH [Paraburkholderia youngii]
MTTNDYGSYLSVAIEAASTGNGVFGTKIHPHQFRYFVERLRTLATYAEEQPAALMNSVLPGLHYVWLSRRDKIQQAVSYLRAIQTNVWWNAPEAPAPHGRPTPDKLRFDFVALEQIVKRMERDEAFWRRYFAEARLDPLRIFYEDVAADPAGQALRVLDYLGVPRPAGCRDISVSMRKQSDSLSENWTRRYRQLYAARAEGTLAAFKNIHVGETIIVCGLGESLNAFDHPERAVTIGVNDIGRRFHPNYLLVVDGKARLTADRFKFVESTEADFVFTDRSFHLPHRRLIRFTLRKGSVDDFGSDDNALLYMGWPWYSPFIALSLAAHMGASRIGLIGIDFAENHFFGQTGPYDGQKHLPEVQRQFGQLGTALAARGIKVFNLSARSALTGFPRLPIDALVPNALNASTPHHAHLTRGLDRRRPIRIVCYSTKLRGGLPMRLAHAITMRTQHHARCVCGETPAEATPFEVDLDWNVHPVAVTAELFLADVIIVHDGEVDRRHEASFLGKPIVTLAHADGGSVNRQFVDAGWPGAVIANGIDSARFAGWWPVPEPILDAELGAHVGVDEARGRARDIVVAFSPTRRVHPKGGGTRASARLELSGEVVEAVLAQLMSDFPVTPHRLPENGAAWLAAGRASRRTAHVIIEPDGVAGVGFATLDALAAGAVVVSGLGHNANAARAFSLCAGTFDCPFHLADRDSLLTVLIGLVRRGADSLVVEGAGNRRWLHQHWDFSRQWDQYWQPVMSESQRAQQMRRGSSSVMMSLRPRPQPVGQYVGDGQAKAPSGRWSHRTGSDAIS